MAQPYLGEIRMFAGNFEPAGWMYCWGQLLPISEYETLFNLIGTTYGGDGESTFGLPDLRGRVPIHFGTSSSGVTYQISESLGVEAVTLTVQQMPNHTHPLVATNDPGAATSPTNMIPAAANVATNLPYGTDNPLGQWPPSSIDTQGGSQPHTNFQPYLCVNFIISLYGIWPSQT